MLLRAYGGVGGPPGHFAAAARGYSSWHPGSIAAAAGAGSDHPGGGKSGGRGGGRVDDNPHSGSRPNTQPVRGRAAFAGSSTRHHPVTGPLAGGGIAAWRRPSQQWPDAGGGGGTVRVAPRGPEQQPQAAHPRTQPTSASSAWDAGLGWEGEEGEEDDVVDAVDFGLGRGRGVQYGCFAEEAAVRGRGRGSSTRSGAGVAGGHAGGPAFGSEGPGGSGQQGPVLVILWRHGHGAADSPPPQKGRATPGGPPLAAPSASLAAAVASSSVEVCVCPLQLTMRHAFLEGLLAALPPVLRGTLEERAVSSLSAIPCPRTRLLAAAHRLGFAPPALHLSLELERVVLLLPPPDAPLGAAAAPPGVPRGLRLEVHDVLVTSSEGGRDEAGPPGSKIRPRHPPGSKIQELRSRGLTLDFFTSVADVRHCCAAGQGKGGVGEGGRLPRAPVGASAAATQPAPVDLDLESAFYADLEDAVRYQHLDVCVGSVQLQGLMPGAQGLGGQDEVEGVEDAELDSASGGALPPLSVNVQAGGL